MPAKKSNFKVNILVGFLIFIVLVQAAIILRLSLTGKQVSKHEIVTIEPVYEPPDGKEKRLRGAEEKERMPRVALIIDDWGYSINNLEFLDNIDVPLTLAILPNQSYSRKISRLAHKKGREVILHLPLEPQSKKKYARLEPKTILTSMESGEVLNILEEDLGSLEHIVGVSNHMGSKATASQTLMEIIFKELSERKLFFLDSLVTPRSVTKKIAKDAKLGWIRRDIFLDNELDYAYIAGQFDKLIKLAKRRGKAVGIGHDRRLTLEVLSDKLSELDLAREPIEFVFVSELVQ